MKKTMHLVAIVTVLLLSQTASAQSGYRTAIGVRLSSSDAIVSNSISLKHFLNDSKAVEVMFAFGDPLAIGALYQVHKPFAAENFQWYYGGGGYLGFLKTFDPIENRKKTEPQFGAQGVLGLDYKFTNAPINLSLDWKPELNLVSDINFEPAAVGLTARFTF